MPNIRAFYLEEWTMKQLLASSDNGVLVLKLPLQRLRKPFYKSSQSAACETLKEHKLYIIVTHTAVAFLNYGLALHHLFLILFSFTS